MAEDQAPDGMILSEQTVKRLHAIVLAIIGRTIEPPERDWLIAQLWDGHLRVLDLMYARVIGITPVVQNVGTSVVVGLADGAPWMKKGEQVILDGFDPDGVVTDDELAEMGRWAERKGFVFTQVPEPEDFKPGRNAPCLCGSGRKWKHCCGKPDLQDPNNEGDDKE
jgi:SEC-C motif